MLRKRTIHFLAVCIVLWILCGPAQAFVVINEVMYHPAGGPGELEFIELLNDSPTTCEIGGWRLGSAIDYKFDAGTSIPANGYCVVGADPEALRKKYNITNTVGPFRGKLDNAGAVIELRNEAGGRIDRVDYSDESPWPVGGDGTGHSIALIDPISDNARGPAWALSREMGGTPGRANFESPPRAPAVFINEILVAGSNEAWVELYNASTGTVDLSGCLVSNEADALDRFAIPNDTSIKPGGFARFTEQQMGFRFSSKQRKLFLSAPKAEYIVDAIAYKNEPPRDQSLGRWPDGAPSFYRMTRPSPDAPNTATLATDVVINEIMYHPFSEDENDEYVELYNRGRSPADLAGWAFTKGIEYEFPDGTTLAPDGYLVIAKNRKALTTRYGISNCLGDYAKSLNDGSDRLVLRDALGNVADEVTYYDGGRWPDEADSGGSSLELTDPRQDNSVATAWAASDETSKSRWTHIEYSKMQRKGNNEFQMFLLGRGVILVDDIELRRDGKNLIGNGTFDQDTKGWTIGGTHKQSDRWTTESRTGDACLRLVAVGGGTTGINSIKTATSGTLETSRTYTVSYWAKWQSGMNRLLTRTHNGGVAQTNAIPVPDRLGTPGARNSRYAENVGPAISALRHDPVTPTSGAMVAVFARIADPDGVASATAHARSDDGSPPAVASMCDDGLHGDGRAGDGLYGGVLPGRPGGTLVEFYVRAVDGRGAACHFPPRAPRYSALYQVHRGAGARAPGDFKTFDVLMTSTTLRYLMYRARSEGRMDNEYLNATLVVNDRLALHNVGVRFHGSVWLRPRQGSVLFMALFLPDPAFRIRLNSDERLFGWKTLLADSQSVDPTRLHESMFFWMLARFGGLPYTQREFVRLGQNGRDPGMLELIQPIDQGFIEDYFPGADDGELYELNNPIEWSGTRFNSQNTRLQYLGADPEPYRFRFEKESHEKEDDYSSVIDLMRIFDSTQTSDAEFERAIEGAIDVDEWLRLIACLAVSSDWDSVAFMTGKNAYLYRRPDTRRWILLAWDKDLTWQSSAMAVFQPNGAGIVRFLQWPPYKRRYFQYIEQLINGPATNEQFDPVADSLRATLARVHPGLAGTKAMKTFITNRRKNLTEKVLPKEKEFRVTTGEGRDFTTDTATVRIEGEAPLCVREIDLNGRPANLRWTDAAKWAIEGLPLQVGPNRFAFTARPLPDGGATSCTLTITRSE